MIEKQPYALRLADHIDYCRMYNLSLNDTGLDEQASALIRSQYIQLTNQEDYLVELRKMRELAAGREQAMERKDALLRKALAVLKKTDCDALYEQNCNVCNIEEAIEKELEKT